MISQNLEAIEIAIAAASEIPGPSKRISTPSLTPNPLGAKNANNPKRLEKCNKKQNQLHFPFY